MMGSVRGSAWDKACGHARHRTNACMNMLTFGHVHSFLAHKTASLTLDINSVAHKINALTLMAQMNQGDARKPPPAA